MTCFTRSQAMGRSERLHHIYSFLLKPELLTLCDLPFSTLRGKLSIPSPISDSATLFHSNVGMQECSQFLTNPVDGSSYPAGRISFKILPLLYLAGLQKQNHQQINKSL